MRGRDSIRRSSLHVRGVSVAVGILVRAERGAETGLDRIIGRQRARSRGALGAAPAGGRVGRRRWTRRALGLSAAIVCLLLSPAVWLSPLAAQPASGDEDARRKYEAADALRVGGQCPAALDAYQDVIVDYPRLPWAGRAELGMGRCLVALGRMPEAMPHLQRVRRYAAAMPASEAAMAIEWNTILARFYLRAASPATSSAAPGAAGTPGATRVAGAGASASTPSTPASTAPSTSGATEPAFIFAGRAGGSTPAPIRDVVAMAIVREVSRDAATPPSGQRPPEQLGVLTEQSFLLYAPQGGVVDSFAVIKPRAVTVDAAGHPLIVTDTGLLRGKTPILPLRVGAVGTTPARPLDELTAACVLSDGTIIAADRKARAIHRFDANGGHLGQLTLMNASRLASNERDDIVALERDGKAIVLLDRQGSVTRRFTTRGDGYLFGDIVDVAIDGIGHIYALDRGQSVVFVFGRDGKLLTTIRSPEIGEGAFKQASSLALDASGRIFLYDERQRQVLIYQ